MNFKWDWDKKELIAGEEPKRRLELAPWLEVFILPALGGIMYVFIEYIAPWIGHIFFGGFL